MDLEFGENLYKNDIFCHYKRDPINKWRNTSIRIRNKTFEIKIFNDIISHEENCSLGYKKCGLVNSNDSLCLKLDEACPINKVLINNNEEYGNYKSFKLGDKYIHYSNEEIDNYLFRKFNITNDQIETSLDIDSLDNLSKYNPEMWQRNSGNAYLNAEYYSIENKENNLKQFEKNKEIIKMYNPEKINDMNEKIGNQTIKNLGIAIFVLTLTSFIIFIIAFLCSNNQQKDTKLNNFNCNCTSSDAFGLIIIIMAIIFSFVFLYIWCIIKLLDLFLGKELICKNIY